MPLTPTRVIEVNTNGQTVVTELAGLGLRLTALSITQAAIDASDSEAPGAVGEFYPELGAIEVAEAGGSGWFDVDGVRIPAPEGSTLADGIGAEAYVSPDGRFRIGLDYGLEVDGVFAADVRLLDLETGVELSLGVSHFGGCFPSCHDLPFPFWERHFVVYQDYERDEREPYRAATHVYDTITGSRQTYKGEAFPVRYRWGDAVGPFDLYVANENSRTRLRLIDLDAAREVVIPLPPDSEYSGYGVRTILGRWMTVLIRGGGISLLDYPTGDEIGRFPGNRSAAAGGEVNVTMALSGDELVYAVANSTVCAGVLVHHADLLNEVCVDIPTLDFYTGMTWSLDTETLTVQGKDGWYVFDVPRSRTFQLTRSDGSNPRSTTWGWYYYPVWSPAGHLLFHQVDADTVEIFDADTLESTVLNFDVPIAAFLPQNPWFTADRLVIPFVAGGSSR